MRTRAQHSALLACLAAGLTLAPTARAQTGTPLPSPFPGPEESFTVASIKPNASSDQQWDFDSPPGRVAGRNVVLRDLIRFAYFIYGGDWDVRIAGPDWIKTARFDIDATTPGAVTQARAMSMLRQLLGDRFKLEVHYEERQRPIYALLHARDDKRLGPQMTRSTVDCAALGAAMQRARAEGTPPPVALDPSQRPVCGSGGDRGTLAAGGYTMEQLALQLARHVDRPVVDYTGLGKIGFDYELRWNPETGPSIFTALSEQLGLKLEPRQGPVTVLVIDSVEPPAPN